MPHPILNLFTNATAHTLKDALPRTIAPIAAATGAKYGTAAAAVVEMSTMMGIFIANPKASKVEAFNTLGDATIAGATIGSTIGYATGYGCANMILRTFPAIGNMESKLLLSSGFKPQCSLFLGSLLVALAIKSMEYSMSEPKKTVAPKI